MVVSQAPLDSCTPCRESYSHSEDHSGVCLKCSQKDIPTGVRRIARKHGRLLQKDRQEKKMVK